MPPDESTVASNATARRRDARNESGRSGEDTRDSTHTNADSSATAASTGTSTAAVSQPCVSVATRP
jgi:hypothetical protein